MFLFNLKSNLNNDSKIYNVKKKKKTTDRKTLDYKHYEMIEYFNKLECQKIDKELLLVKYQKEYDNIFIDYNEITNKLECDKININEFEDYQKQKGQLYLELRKKGYIIDDLKLEIKKLDNSVEENEYYNRVDDILFQYYSFFENNVDILENENIPNNKDIDEYDMESDLDDSDMEESLSDSDTEENDMKQINIINYNINSKTKNIQTKPKINNIQSKNNILYFFGVSDENECENKNSNENVQENEVNKCDIYETQMNVIKKKNLHKKVIYIMNIYIKLQNIMTLKLKE